MASQVGEVLADDLECGGNTLEEEVSSNLVPGCISARKTLNRAYSGALSYNGCISGDSNLDPSGNFSKSINIAGQRVEILIERGLGREEPRDIVALLEKRNPSDQSEKAVLKKVSKPPRPPKGPLLNASDLKLVKELSELAARKRARVERMKALRKMKEAKRTSSSSSLTAMVITVLFFLVIILQGYLTSHI